MNPDLENFKKKIRNIPDFPVKGIQFKDITTVLNDPELLQFALDHLYEKYKNAGITKVLGIESRGFILGGALAARLNAGFIPVRKPGKLPYKTISVKYMLEYGEDQIEMHEDALTSSDRVLIHDDLLATGGTACAAVQLINKFGIENCDIKMAFLIELDFLKGKDYLKGCDVYSMVHF